MLQRQKAKLTGGNGTSWTRLRAPVSGPRAALVSGKRIEALRVVMEKRVLARAEIALGRGNPEEEFFPKGGNGTRSTRTGAP